MTLYHTRNRLEPWEHLLPIEKLETLKHGGIPENLVELENLILSVGLWPDGPIPGLEKMTMHVDTVSDGIVKIVLLNERKTILLVFILDYLSGKAHAILDDGGLVNGNDSPDETDVKAHATFFYKVLCNDIAELTIENMEPVDCEVVIPVNIMPLNPDDAISEAVQKFKAENEAQKNIDEESKK